MSSPSLDSRPVAEDVLADTPFPIEPSDPVADPSRTVNGQQAISQQIRGSSLLIAGRGIALGLNLVAQVVTIRYLTKSDFGAVAWAFSAIELLSLLILCGMNKSLSRFGAIYHERQEASRFRGAIVFPIVSVSVLGSGVALALYFGEDSLLRLLSIEASTVLALKVMAILIPLNALGSICLSIYTVLGKTQTVFLRRQLLGPVIRTLAVVVAVIADGGLIGISLAWLVSGIVSAVIDVVLTSRLLREDHVFRAAEHGGVMAAGRDLLSFGIPILSSDLAFMIRGSMLVLLLGWLSTTNAAASYRAVLPLVRLNELVLVNFTLVFTPLASRLFATGRRENLASLFHCTTLWALVMSFPVFAFCVLFANHITSGLFGAEYADAAGLLIVLSLGYLLQVFVGFNSRMLKIEGHLRVFVTLDFIDVVISLGLSALLIPLYGAMGAAMAVTGGLVIYSLGRFLAVRAIIGWSPWSEDSGFVFVTIGLLATGLAAVQLLWPLPLPVLIILFPASSFFVVMIARRHLQAGAHFPELQRIPFVRRLLPRGER